MQTPDPTTSEPKTRLPGLDALRAFSIVWVVIFHLENCFATIPTGPVADWIRKGINGVTIFFVISGFLITTLLLDEEERRGRISLCAFYRRRAFRILPAACVYLGVASAVARFTGMAWYPPEWLGSAFFFRNLVTGNWSGLTSHFWSLSVEEQFYLVWPVAVVLSHRRHRAWATVALCLAAPVWRHVVTKLAHGGPINIGRLDLIYDALLIGAALALLQRNQGFKSLLDRPFLAPVVLVVAAGGFGYLTLNPLPFGMVGVVAKPTVHLACIAAVIKVLVEGRCLPIQIACAWAPVVWLGKISYSLYLWHMIFLVPVVFTGWHLGWRLACILACASASYYWIERPMLRLRTSLASSKPRDPNSQKPSTSEPA